VAPEIQPLLANGSETTFLSKKLLGKHILEATDAYATIEVLLKTMFLLGPCKGAMRKTIWNYWVLDFWGNQVSPVRESVKKRLERVVLKNLHCYKRVLW
jgi:hypothetical protein